MWLFDVCTPSHLFCPLGPSSGRGETLHIKLVIMSVTEELVMAALATVNDPEIHRPITDLNMVDSVVIDGSHVTVNALLTVAGCPMKNTIQSDIVEAVGAIEGVEHVSVNMGAMNRHCCDIWQGRCR